jgi:Transcriptional regulator, AbiEi antitoxin/Protein of unknown function (DUF559)
MGSQLRSGLEREVSKLATHQHGVVARRQLLNLGLTPRMIQRRIDAGRLHCLHRGVYAYGHQRLTQKGRWMAAVLASGDGAALSHRSAAALWGFARSHRGPLEVVARTSRGRRGRRGILTRERPLAESERTAVAAIPVTSAARTLLDLAEVVDEDRLTYAFAEADRLRLLQTSELEAVCARSPQRRSIRPIRRLIDEARAEELSRSPLEDRVIALCRKYELPMPATNVDVLGDEVDAFWPRERLIVEADSIAFHSHRAAFERDPARDAKRQVEGYRVIRLTHRRLTREPDVVAGEIRRLLRGRQGERGQGTVEWIGLVAVVALLLVGLVGAGVRMPGTALASAVASRMLCAAALAERCGDEPRLIAAYGTEVGKLVRRHMPTILFERGSRALPVDFRRCRRSTCADGSVRGLVNRSDAGLPVTAFVHVVDCRRDAAEATEAAGADCSGSRANYLYLQYWTYYADSATLRGVPIAGAKGFHADDWESTQIRIGQDGQIDQRASSHHGYNHVQSAANAASDAGLTPLRDAAETLGARPRNGWGPETRLLVVSGGSHAGNANGFLRVDRIAPGRRVHLVPLEPIAAEEGRSYRFAVSPPWLKKVWRDPEAAGTD